MSRIEYLCPTWERPVKIMSAIRARCRHCRKDYLLEELARIRSATMLGAGGPSSLAPATIVHCENPVTVTTCTIPGVAAAAGSTLIVHVGTVFTGIGGAPTSVLWGSNALTNLSSSTNGLGLKLRTLSTFFFQVSLGATRDVVMTFDPGALTVVVGSAITVPFASSANAGSAIDDASGDPAQFSYTPPSAQGSQAAVVALLFEAPDSSPLGSWASGYTFVQRAVEPSSSSPDQLLLDVADKIGASIVAPETVGESGLGAGFWCGVADQFV